MLFPISLLIIESSLFYVIASVWKQSGQSLLFQLLRLLLLLLLSYILQQLFPMIIMCPGLKSPASSFHPCQLIEEILMCMEPSILIRYGSCCISAPACDMPVAEIIVIVKIIVSVVIIISYCIVKNACTSTLSFCMRVWCSWSSGQARSYVLGWPVFEFPWLTKKSRTYSFCWCYHCWGYCHYCDYFADKCTAQDIGIDRIKGHYALYNCLVLGHTKYTKYNGVQRVYCNPFPAKPLYGSHRLDLVMIRPPASRYWKWCIRGLTRFSLVCTGFAPFLCLSTNWHRVQIVWLCSLL